MEHEDRILADKNRLDLLEKDKAMLKEQASDEVERVKQTQVRDEAVIEEVIGYVKQDDMLLGDVVGLVANLQNSLTFIANEMRTNSRKTKNAIESLNSSMKLLTSALRDLNTYANSGSSSGSVVVEVRKDDGSNMGSLKKAMRDVIPKYNGDKSPTMIENFISRIEDYLRIDAAIARSFPVTFAANYLVDVAKIWWRGIRTTIREPDLAGFFTALRAHFLPANALGEAREKLALLKQKTSVLSYLTEFQKILNQIPDMTEAEKLHRFKSGLKPNIRTHIELRPDIVTFPNVAQVAISIDDIFFKVYPLKKTAESTASPASPSKTASSSSGTTPMDVDRIKTLSKLTAQEKADCLQPGACFRCRQTGHLSSNCPTFKNRVNAMGTQTLNEEKEE